MKTLNFILCTLLLLSTSTINGQTPWFLTGNTPGGTDFMGSTDASDVMFRTNNTERMRINGTAGGTQGFIGIGTNNPQSSLHLHGTFQLTSAATNAGSGDGLLIRNSASGGPVDFVQQETDGFRFYTPSSSGVQKMIIKNTGEIGFGSMSNPGNKVEIESANSIQLRLTYTGAGSYFTTLGENTNGDFQIYANKGADERGVVIGTNNASPAASGKLHVVGSPFSNGIYVSNTVTSSNGMLIENTGTTSSGLKASAVSVGAWGLATGNPQNGYATNGVRGEVSNSNTGSAYTNGNAGVYGNVIASGSGALNMGVIGLAMLTNSSGSNLGVYARANNGNVNYGIYAEVQGGSSSGTVENYAGKFAGDIGMAGSGYASGTWVNGSDSTIKNDIVEIQDPLDALSKLKGYEYTYDTEGFPSLNLPEGKHYGLIAQEVETQFPNAVKQINFPAKVDTNGNVIYDAVKIKGIEYNSVTAIIVESVNQLNLKVEELQSQLDGCCGGQMRLQDQGSNPIQQVSIVSESFALLGDCVPNPNDGKTKVTVRIPQSVANAEIIFTDQLGKEVSRIAISNRGYSDLEITTAGLENGVYHYSLVVDGKLIDTKQMLKQH